MPYPVVGQSFARYRVDAFVAQGGMGAVFRATDQTLGRSVALKVIRQEAAPTAAASPGASPPSGPSGPSASDGASVDDIGRFLREGKIAAQLAHPNIVVTYDIGAWDGIPFIAMEWVDGVSLDRIAERGVPLSRRLQLLGEVADAMAYAHERGVVHRDIKPSNVLVDAGGTGRARLADFGIARRTHRDPMEGQGAGATFSTREGVIIGTPSYMAPEQMLTSEVGPAADQFSWGVLAFEVINGVHPRNAGVPFPFRGSAEVPWRVSLPPAITDIVRRSMAIDPDGRFRTTRELAAAWSAAVGLGSGSLLPAAPTISTMPALPGGPSGYPPAPAVQAHGGSAHGYVPPAASTTSALAGPAALAVGPPPAQQGGRGALIGVLVAVGLLAIVAGGAFAAWRSGYVSLTTPGPAALPGANATSSATAATAAAPAAAAPAAAGPAAGSPAAPAGAPPGASPPSPAARTPGRPAGPTVDGGAAADAGIAVVDAGGGGRTATDAGAAAPSEWKISSLSARKPYTTGDVRNAVNTQRAAIAGCYERAGPNRPDFTLWKVEIAPAGTGTPASDGGERGNAAFEGCILKALGAVKWPPRPDTAKVTMSFSAPGYSHAYLQR